jgi:serine/threonine-protein kinase
LRCDLGGPSWDDVSAFDLDSAVCGVVRGRVHCSPDGESVPDEILGDARDVAVDGSRVCVAEQSGRVVCWRMAGDDGEGTPPEVVVGLADAIDVDVGHDWGCARTRSGALQCFAEHGPREMRGLRGARDLSIGARGACVVRAEGDVACFDYERGGLARSGGSLPAILCRERPECIRLPAASPVRARHGHHATRALELAVRIGGGRARCGARAPRAGRGASATMTFRVLPSQRPPLAPGTPIGKYVVEGHLGEGGNGAVYAALDTVLGRRVALKLLHPQLVFDPQIAGRFRQEAQAMAQLNHPNVVTVHDFVGESGTWAIVMELVEGGETLASLLRREGRLAPARAIHLMKQVAAGLGHAHGRGVVHRDVKPANMMIVRHGANELAKISDFGIARLVHGEKRTQGQLTLGTLWYLAPEQAQSSSVDARADVYALGASLYETLTGRVVFPYDNVARVLAAAIAEQPTPPSSLVPGIAPALDALVLRFIAKQPDARPAHGDEARALLEQVEALLNAEERPGPSSRSGVATPHAHLPGPATGALEPKRPGVGSAPPPAAGAAPPSPTSAAMLTDESRRLGLSIGVGVTALVAAMCLLSAFLCVLSWILRS